MVPDAIELYRRAIEHEERVGALIWAMHHRLRRAEAMVAARSPGEAGEAGEAGALLARVEREAPAMGLTRLAERAGAAAHRLISV